MHEWKDMYDGLSIDVYHYVNTSYIHIKNETMYMFES
jgi:hypothetical protein